MRAVELHRRLCQHGACRQAPSEINALKAGMKPWRQRKQSYPKKLAQYESSLAEGDDVIKEKLQALEKERIAAGYTDVSGSGIIIAIDVDSTSDYHPSLYASHAELLWNFW